MPTPATQQLAELLPANPARGFSTPYYGAFSDQGDLVAAIPSTLSDTQRVRLVDPKSGEVISEGVGAAGAQQIATLANAISKEQGGKAAWDVRFEKEPDSFVSAGGDDVNHPHSNLLSMAIPIIASMLAGPLGPALGGLMGIGSSTASALIAGAGGALGGSMNGGGLKGAVIGGLSGGLGYGLGNTVSHGLQSAVAGATGGGAASGAVGAGLAGAGSGLGGAVGSAVPGTVSELVVNGALAPGVGAALGGSLGGIAGGALTQALNKPPATSNINGQTVTEVDPVDVIGQAPGDQMLPIPGLPGDDGVPGVGTLGSQVVDYGLNHDKPFDPVQFALDTAGQTIGQTAVDVGLGLAFPQGTPDAGFDAATDPSPDGSGGVDPATGITPTGDGGGDPGGGDPAPRGPTVLAGGTGGGALGGGGGGAPSGGGPAPALASIGGPGAGPSSLSAPSEINKDTSQAPDIYPWRKVKEPA